ncbi:DNA replication/repair protein RecF [Aestuariicella hydrocarbonica]|uniref:DNA replication and repair protein RecF n=1 Tax=Pseudomaricurvus hydrocarbonicus TaxID=1470433 RepID=A0A9E5T4R8_9GAMM|nr:DNA replication/repair protein RecF [Aestuariicella hydrocarbonica]NHO68252.1 DNA replication/repair protein RecF [Aestuariicella hydrocarbonica]
MTLRRLSAQNFRNLQAVDIELSPQLNIFYGDNGSGKTSILEAISTLSLGRSFRSRKFKTMIHYDADAYTVFGRVDISQQSPLVRDFVSAGGAAAPGSDVKPALGAAAAVEQAQPAQSNEAFLTAPGPSLGESNTDRRQPPEGDRPVPAGIQLPVGVQRSRDGQVLIKKGGQPCSSAAELAETLPVRVMNGHSFSLLEGAPLVRRQFLDWLVFHVEHDFYKVWRSYEKCLKHRNSLLRRGKIEASLLAPWDRELAALAARLDSFREAAFDRLRVVFSRLISGFEGLEKLSIRYYRGWDAEHTFAELLETTQERDADLGYTRQGPHRADVKIMVGKTAAVDLLSRGQQKIVVSALLIAQGMVYSEQRQRRCVYLIDDLPAELDEHFRLILADWLVDMGCQVFVTGVEKQPLLAAWRRAVDGRARRREQQRDVSGPVLPAKAVQTSPEAVGESAEVTVNDPDNSASVKHVQGTVVTDDIDADGVPGCPDTIAATIENSGFRVFHVKHGVVELEPAP